MNKVKCLLFIFALMLAGTIAGSVAILNVAQNQTIDDFELEMVEGSDPTVIDGIGFNVEYGISKYGIREYDFYRQGFEGEKCEFQYIDGEIRNLKFTEAKEKERRGEGVQPWEMFEQYEYISDNRVVAIHEYEKRIEFWVTEFDDTSIPTAKVIEIGGLPVASEKYMWTTNDDVYFFENGCLCKVSKAELMELSTEYINGYYATGDHVYYAPFYTVPDEIETIIGCEGGELLYLVGIGDVTVEGYNLYTYIVDVTTGETLDRQCYEKKLSDELAKNNLTCLEEYNELYIIDLMSYDYLAKDSDSILTITYPTGYQDMFVIEKTASESKIHNLNVSDLLAENLYISDLIETENSGDDTLYLIYAEGQINKSDYDANWSRRVIMKLEEKIMGYNGIAFIAIQNGEVVYKGYFASETSKALGYVTEDLLEGYNYSLGSYLPEAYVEQITISVP